MFKKLFKKNKKETPIDDPEIRRYKEYNSLLIANYDNTPKFEFSGTYVAKVLDVYDGDTITVATYFNNEIKRFTLRMNGYDSAEMRPKKKDHPDEDSRKQEKKQARADRKFLLRHLCDPYDKNISEEDNLLNNQRLFYAEFLGTDKYGRILAEIYLDPIPIWSDVNNPDIAKILSNNMNKLMITAGHGYAYDGGTKKKFNE